MSAIKKTFDINLDTKREDVNRGFHLIEGDNGNVFHIILTDDGTPVDLTGTMVNVVFSSKNGVVSQASDVEDGGVTIGGTNHNEITIDLFKTSYGIGLNEVEVQVYSKSDSDLSAYDTLITTARFNFTGVRSLINDDTIHATNDFPILIALIEAAQTALSLATPFTSATAHASQGNNADITLTVGEDSVHFEFVIPNGVYIGASDTTPPDDAEVWIIPDGEGGSTEGTVMNTEVYDQDGDGIVDDAEKLGGELPSYYAKAADLTSEITNRGNAITTEVSNRNTAISTAITTNVTNKLGAASGIATLDANAKVPAYQATSHVFTIDEDTTLALTHAGGFLNTVNEDGDDITITVPDYNTVAFPVDTEIILHRYGEGEVTIAPGGGVTICTSVSPITIPAQYKAIGIKKIATDVWAIFGL